MKFDSLFWFLLFLLATPILLSGQTKTICNCYNTCSSVVSSVENNYVAFEEKTKTNRKEYDKLKSKLLLHNDKSGLFKCYKKIREYFSFFSDPHLSINLNVNKETEALFHQEFSQLPKYKNWEKVIERNSGEKGNDSLTGMWISEDQVYQIALVKGDRKKYYGIITKADGVFWFPGQVKLKIDFSKPEPEIVYYRRDHMPLKSKFKFLDGNFLVTGYGFWSKINAQKKSNLKEKSFYFELLDSSVCILRMPNFFFNAKQKIDSIVGANIQSISNCANLIIDIRDNPGGFSFCFDTILPFIQSGYLQQYSFSALASKDNIDLYKLYAKKNNLMDDTGLMALIALLEENRGHLTEIQTASQIIYDSVFANPRRVVILVNGGTGSASEDLLLRVRPSRKVLVMGERTKGAFDNQNILMPRNVNACPYFIYNCPVATSKDAPKIDNIGITPDIIIPAEKDWIRYVLEYLKAL